MDNQEASANSFNCDTGITFGGITNDLFIKSDTPHRLHNDPLVGRG